MTINPCSDNEWTMSINGKMHILWLACCKQNMIFKVFDIRASFTTNNLTNISRTRRERYKKTWGEYQNDLALNGVQTICFQ